MFECCLVLLASPSSDELQSKETNLEAIREPHSISIELLSLICPPVVLYKAKSLLYNSLSLPSLCSSSTSIVSLYNNYKDDALLSLISTTYKLKAIKDSIDYRLYFNDFEDYLDQIYDFETLQKTLIACKSLVQQQRANNLVKFINDKFNMATNAQKHFISSLNGLFWRIINRSPFNNQPFSNSSTLNLIVDCYLRLLCSDILEINFASRKVLLALIKPSKPSLPLPPPQPQLIVEQEQATIAEPRVDEMIIRFASLNNINNNFNTHIIRSILMNSMTDWYMKAQNTEQNLHLARILDLSQDLKALSILLGGRYF